MNKVKRPEFELLIRSCGVARNLPVRGAATQTQLPAGFDENLFVNMAIQHKTVATAYTGLKKLGISLNPDNSLRLKQRAVQGRLVRSLIFEDACAIVETLGKQGIPALILKGPASSIELYGDALVREYDDLDILVNLPDVGPAIPFMAELGFTTKEFHLLKKADSVDIQLLQRTHHVTFWKEGCPFRVEMHDRTGWEHELFRHDDIDAVFLRAAVLEFSGKCLAAPDLPDHAALILAHGVKHAWCLLHWILDASVLLSHKDETLHRVIAARIRELAMQSQLKLTGGMVRTLYPIELPPAIESVIFGEPEFKNSLAFAMDRLQTGGRDITSIKNTIAFDVFYSPPLLGSVKEKLTSVLRLLRIPQVDVERLSLPRQLFFLHFLLRPFIIVSRRLKRCREKRATLHV